MGKQSSTNPMRGPARHGGTVSGQICAAICAAICLTMPAWAQTQGATLPLVLPAAIAFDEQGDLFIADAGNQVVRELSVAGVVTTVAGNGVQGFAGDNGPATAAELDSPMGLAVDAAGNLYIADSHNHRVRVVTAATGVIATVAGTGAAGFFGDGGPAKAAMLDLPTALALDSAGNVYVADTDNHRIRRIAAATGTIATVAGNGVEGFAGDAGPATAASIDSPSGLAVDAAGNLYLADTHNGRVRTVKAATGAISTVAGVGSVGGNVQEFGGDAGPATAAGMALPRGLTLDAAGNLYVADSANHRIRRISAAGTITTIAGEGTETFAGDGAPAVTASLDTPRAVTLSASGLVTLADSGNQRVRQIDALPAPGPDIHTVAGLGSTGQGSAGQGASTLAIAGPSVIAYGSGTVTATLSVASPATGSITFLDTSGGTATTLGTAALNATNTASLNTATLAAGAHSLVAVYPGDATHAAAQSSAFAITVTPLAVTATANPASIVYGQPVPVFGGVLSGVLPQDAGTVAAVFTTSAGALSPVGTYSITATLTGSAAGNYAVAVTPADLNIAKAQSLATLANLTSSPSVGVPVTLSAKVASATSGVPTGSITLMDGAAVLGVAPLSAAGGATFTTSSLALGTHTLSAAYAGDSNFLPSSPGLATVVVGAGPDFTLAATGLTTQSVAAGNAATFTFSAAIEGAGLSSPITLAVQGTPPGATASLNPANLPPGGTVTSFTLTIQMPLTVILEKEPRPFAPRPSDFSRYGSGGLLAVLLLPAFGFGSRFRRRRVGRLILMAAVCILPASLATGCGNRVNTAPEFANAQTYTLTVTGTATGPAGNALVHSASVSLEVL
jgi:sugar lactone lactonase YvrE